MVVLVYVKERHSDVERSRGRVRWIDVVHRKGIGLTCVVQ